MRSLQDWTRYLEQQEQEVTPGPRTPEPRVEEAPTLPAPPRQVDQQPRAAAPAPPVEEDTPAFLRVPRETPVEAPPPAPPVTPQVVQPAPERKPARPAEKLTQPQKPPARKEAIAKAVNLRKRLPANLNTESLHEREVAKASYKTFKESREELIQRLVDPILSLEEVARILNVCPTTVRRYTNRGALAHQRTAGNQRRFRLSDVLAFLEQQSGGLQE